jgi:outer membrane protein assembly factor BamB
VLLEYVMSKTQFVVGVLVAALSAASASAFEPLGVPDYTDQTGVVSHAELPVTEPKVLWSVPEISTNSPNRGLTSPVVADGILYYGDEGGGFAAVRISDQSVLWTHAHGARAIWAPSVDGEQLYFASDRGITALDRETGQQTWQYLIQLGTGSTPLPVGDHVYAAGDDGICYCLNRQTGKQVWTHNFIEDAPPPRTDEFDGKKARFGDILARPSGAATDGEILVQAVFDQSRVIALDCQTGKRRWTFQADGWVSSVPTLANGRVYVTSQDSYLYCLDANTGDVVWKFKTPGWYDSNPAVHDGHVYLSYHRAKLFQLDVADGHLVRTIEPPDAEDRKGYDSNPLISGQTLYITTTEGLILAFDLESSQLRWKLRPVEKAGLHSDLVTDGRRLFVSTRGEDGAASVVVAVGLE